MSELKDRIKLIRKSLKLTQEDFSERIGLARNSLASYEIGRREPINSIIISICREFNVNEEWLRNGQGEMFIETDNSIIEQLVSAYKLNDVSKKILETFLELTEPQKDAICNFFQSLSEKFSDDTIATTLDNPCSSNDDIELEIARYRMELEAEKKGKISLASDEQKHA